MVVRFVLKHFWHISQVMFHPKEITLVQEWHTDGMRRGIGVDVNMGV
jgi:hypothetical protein